MEPIDTAYAAFQMLTRESETYLNSLETEADTRLKIIDRLLVEVLHWPYVEISTEAATEGGFADYVCRVQERSRLVVEAKRDGRSLGCEGRPRGAAFKLTGGVFKAESAKEGIGQAIRYCGAKNAELACVTNGREWIIFRGTRLGDGLDTRDGERAVKMVLEIQAREGRGRGEVARVARQLGIHRETLRVWVRQAEVDGGQRPGTTTGDARRIAELEPEVRELRRAPMKY